MTSITTPITCFCGGETKYYHGLLGYEAQVCEKCKCHYRIGMEPFIGVGRAEEMALAAARYTGVKVKVRVSGNPKPQLEGKVLRDQQESGWTYIGEVEDAKVERERVEYWIEQNIGHEVRQ